MTRHGKMRLGAALGLVWAVGVMVVGGMLVTLPVFTLMPTIMTAFLAPGLVLLAMVLRVAQQRAAEDTPDEARAATTDSLVMQATVAQLVLALAIWPAAAVLLAGKGPGLIMTLGVAFVLARLAYWIGCHRGATLRTFGFAATVLPTAMAAAWALWNVATGFQ